MGKGLVILHLDGLGATALERALAAGQMPFVRRLIDGEGYQIQPYRCGVPSTTPYAQAGILYGDSSEIPPIAGGTSRSAPWSALARAAPSSSSPTATSTAGHR